MRGLAFTFAAACACLALAGAAQAALSVGVVDDGPKGAPDGGAAFFALMNDVGLQEVRLTVLWDPAQPETIPYQTEIASVLPVATLRGVRVVLSVQPMKATSITDSPAAPDQFVAFLQLLMRTFPTVKDVIVGNEPNQPRFWRPQFDARQRGVSAAAYEPLLARAYDALKEVDPTLNVIGVGLSPRGNDNPRASENISTSPVKFLRGLGAAYRASGRAKPLMDELAFHPYPNQNTDPLLAGYEWPNAGMPNLGRVKQAFYDAFHGTAQKTFEQGLKMKLDEVGWQVAVVAGSAASYYGAENVSTTDEQTQAFIYGALLRFVACDPAVESVLFFGFQDEPSLDRWQAALLRADGTKRPAYDVVKATIAQTGGRCAGAMQSWRHSMTVDGAEATFPRAQSLPRLSHSFSFLASADEDATFDAGIYRLVRGRLGAAARMSSGRLKAHVTRFVRFSGRIRPGRYVYSIRFRAEMNPERWSRVTSRPFTVRGPR